MSKNKGAASLIYVKNYVPLHKFMEKQKEMSWKSNILLQVNHTTEWGPC